MKCTKCGNELQEGADVCSFCGMKVAYGDISQEQTYSQQQYYDQQQQNYYNKSEINPQYKNFQYSQPKQNANVYNHQNANPILKKINVFAIVFSVVLIISTILPYDTATYLGVKSESTLIDLNDGWFFFVLAILALGFALKNLNIGIIIIGAIGTFLMFIEVRHFADTVANTEYGYIFHKASGYYLMILGTLGILISGIIRFILDKKEE